MAQKMLHTCLRVQDLEKSIKFYQETFGFKETRRKEFPEHKFTICYLSFDDDDYELELTYNYDHGPYIIGDGFAHIAISADDLEKTHQKHIDLGYEARMWVRSCRDWGELALPASTSSTRSGAGIL